jgi:glycosyltransferase involved in cell wall biosynthesis
MIDFTTICLSTAYFDEKMWTNRQHLMARLAQKQRVLYIEPGLFNKKYFWQKLFLRPWALLTWPLRKKNNNLWILSLHWLPLYRGPRWLVNLGWYWISLFIKRFLNKNQKGKIVLWTYQADVVNYLQLIACDFLIYDCVDEFSAIPYYFKHPNKQSQFIAMEEKLIRIADLTIVTSQTLYEKKSQWNPGCVMLIENVGDFHHFQTAQLSGPVPKQLRKIPRPQVGFFGAISSYKVDFELLIYCAQRLPRVQFVLLGPIGEGDRSTRLVDLRGIKNIFFFGQVPYADLPGWIRSWDACLIPYKLSRYTEGVFPIKFFECLASGKPLVSTALPTLQKYKKLFHWCRSKEEFVAAIQKILGGEDPETEKKQRLALAGEHTWETRLTSILDKITRLLLEKE